MSLFFITLSSLCHHFIITFSSLCHHFSITLSSLCHLTSLFHHIVVSLSSLFCLLNNHWCSIPSNPSNPSSSLYCHFFKITTFLSLCRMVVAPFPIKIVYDFVITMLLSCFHFLITSSSLFYHFAFTLSSLCYHFAGWKWHHFKQRIATRS